MWCYYLQPFAELGTYVVISHIVQVSISNGGPRKSIRNNIILALHKFERDVEFAQCFQPP